MTMLNTIKEALLDPEFLQLVQQHAVKIASTTELGHVKVGENLTITEDGTLNAASGMTEEESQEIRNHILSNNNPHGVTTSQVTKITRTLFSDPPSKYPIGASVNEVSSADGWGRWGTVLTVKGVTNDVGTFQIYTPNTPVEGSIMIRRKADQPDTWTAFEQFIPLDTGWINATLQTGWTTVTNGFLQYRKIGEIVHVRAKVATSDATVGSKLMTVLPAGYRPRGSVSTNSAYGDDAFVRVFDTGNIVVYKTATSDHEVNFESSFIAFS